MTFKSSVWMQIILAEHIQSIGTLTAEKWWKRSFAKSESSSTGRALSNFSSRGSSAASAAVAISGKSRSVRLPLQKSQQDSTRQKTRLVFWQKAGKPWEKRLAGSPVVPLQPLGEDHHSLIWIQGFSFNYLFEKKASTEYWCNVLEDISRMLK